jgi:CubicO group peptidase (beta-lactamase class C family)
MVAVLLLGATGCNEPSDAAQPEPPESAVSRLDAELPGLLEEYDVPGAAIAMVEQGEVVWSKGYGSANVADETPVTSETVFQVASISKPVAAWGVMRLVDEQAINLDAPIDQYLYRWHIPPSELDAKQVTARRLLSHTGGTSMAGYPGYPPEQPLPGIVQSLNGEPPGIGPVELVTPPGTTFQYSGGGYGTLQLAMEDLTNQTFVDYMQEVVLAPLEMESSSFEWTPALQPRTATPYDPDGAPLPNYLFAEKAAAGLYATAADIGRFAAAAMKSGSAEPGREVLKTDTVELMTLRVANSPYGLGYDVAPLPGGGVRIGHFGANHGWRSLFFALPEQGRAFVVLTNSDNGIAPQLDAGFAIDALCIWSGEVSAALPECPPRSS